MMPACSLWPEIAGFEERRGWEVAAGVTFALKLASSIHSYTIIFREAFKKKDLKDLKFWPLFVVRFLEVVPD